MRSSPVLHFAPMEMHSVREMPSGWRMRAAPSGVWWRDAIARLCWNVLERLAALEPFGYTSRIYTYGEAEQGAVADMILKQVDALPWNRADFHFSDYAIVIGAKEFAEMMQGMPVHDMLTVGAAPIYRSAPGGYRHEFQGLPVHVIPNLSGVAVLPRAIVERRAPAEQPRPNA